MPLKKKKGKKKKKVSASAKSDGSASDAAGKDPDTLLGAEDGKKGKKGKKKGKKGRKKKGKKLTKAEKVLEKLEKKCDDIRNSGEPYEHFVDRMDRWLKKNTPQAVDLFKRFDVDGNGVLSYEEFKSGMFDMNVPCNMVELHLLTQLLDRDGNGEIVYMEFSRGLQNLQEVAESADESESEEGEEEEAEVVEEAVEKPSYTVKLFKHEPPEHCVCCKLALCGPYREKNPKYIELLLRLVTFEPLRSHPGHFNQVVHAHMPVYGIVQLIQEHAGISSSTLAIFTDKSRTREAMLDPHLTLEECGMTGGPRNSPQEALLFYDYTVEFSSCPLLNCDHYFGEKLAS